jgi:hypothetical protein
MQVHANEGGVTQTRGGIYWIILPAGCKSLVPHILLSYMIGHKNENKIAQHLIFFYSEPPNFVFSLIF